MKRVLTMDLASSDVYDVIRNNMPEGFQLVTLETGTLEDRVAKITGCDFVISAVGAVPTEAIQASDRLVLIQHQGVGVDKTDVDLATRMGIEVCITPEGTTIGVAEHVVLLVLTLYKRMREIDRKMELGGFPMWELRTRSHEIYGKTVGMVGFGRIARATAERFRAFGAEILFHDRYAELSPEDLAASGATQADSLDDLLARSDIVSLHTPSTEETRGMVDAAFLGKMKRNALLINTARGDLVNEKDFFTAMNEGIIAGAGIDVFAREPLPADSEYRRLPNVVLTPHVSAGTLDALTCKLRHVFANIQRFMSGEETWHSLNRDKITSRRR